MGLLSTEAFSLKQLSQVAEQGRLFAIIDPCDEPRAVEKLEELGHERALCLYRKRLRAEDRDALPHIAQIDDATLDWLHNTLWQEPWGVFLFADRPLRALRIPLRKLLKALDPAGNPTYFRYYDPRVLKTFLPECSESQLLELFDEIFAFGTSEKDSTVAVYRPSKSA